MTPVNIPAVPRVAAGKGAARRLRTEGHIPAVAYGRDLAPTQLTIQPDALRAVLRGEYGTNTVVEIDVGERKIKALVREYQYHPLTRDLVHADFVEIKDDRPVDIDVPFETIGRAAGVIIGGVARVVFRRLPVRCLPKDIPVKISHDVSAVELEHGVAAKELALPSGVTLRLPPEQTVFAVAGDKPEEEEAAPTAEAAAGAVPADGDKAAPGAAGAKAPAADAKAPAAGGKAAAGSGKDSKKK